MTDIVRYDLEPTSVDGFMVIEATEAPTGRWVTYEAAAQAIEELRRAATITEPAADSFHRRMVAAEAEVTRLREALASAKVKPIDMWEAMDDAKGGTA